MRRAELTDAGCLVVQSEFRHTWSSVDGCRLLPTDWDMAAAEGVWDLLPDASTNLVQAYHLWTITVGETGTSARGAAEAECVLVLQVIPTPLHVLGRISPIFSPFFPVFCAFSLSRRGGSNEPKTGIQGQETASRAPRHRFSGLANSGCSERMARQEEQRR